MSVCIPAKLRQCCDPILFSSCRRRAAGSLLPCRSSFLSSWLAATRYVQRNLTCAVDVCEVPVVPEPLEGTSTSSPHCQPHLLCPALPLTCQGQKALQGRGHSQGH